MSSKQSTHQDVNCGYLFNSKSFVSLPSSNFSIAFLTPYRMQYIRFAFDVTKRPTARGFHTDADKTLHWYNQSL
jgi:hypothetical protein